jgi:hypothetical protein
LCVKGFWPKILGLLEGLFSGVSGGFRGREGKRKYFITMA